MLIEDTLCEFQRKKIQMPAATKLWLWNSCANWSYFAFPHFLSLEKARKRKIWTDWHPSRSIETHSFSAFENAERDNQSANAQSAIMASISMATVSEHCSLLLSLEAWISSGTRQWAVLQQVLHDWWGLLELQPVLGGLKCQGAHHGEEEVACRECSLLNGHPSAQDRTPITHIRSVQPRLASPSRGTLSPRPVLIWWQGHGPKHFEKMCLSFGSLPFLFSRILSPIR